MNTVNALKSRRSIIVRLGHSHINHYLTDSDSFFMWKTNAPRLGCLTQARPHFCGVHERRDDFRANEGEVLAVDAMVPGVNHVCYSNGGFCA
jgi:hypothetical protein